MMRARWRVRRGGKLGPLDVSRIRATTLPTDIDLLRHMNNGRYLSIVDLGRWDLLIRTGLFDAMAKQRWYAVVSSETVTFRKSLTLFQRFDIASRMIGHDDRAIYMEHRVLVGNEIYATVIVRSRILKMSGGTVSNEELFATLGRPEGIPEIDPWVHEWAQASRLPSTRKPAQSDW